MTDLSRNGRTRVLIADDERHIRLLFKSMLTQNKYDVVGEAANGQEALEMFGRLEPDILLMDINMPYKTGIEALETLMAQEAQALVIMLTSVADTASVAQCIELGAGGYIRKDTPLEEVARIIEEAYDLHLGER